MSKTKKKTDIAPEPASFNDDPLWYKDAVIYQLHIKSFFDGNNDGIGDFPGLIDKLDYIKSLGVNTIWVLPFYPSPRRDDGYDIGEYRDVHPDYGTMADARRFIHSAHAKGLRVITELVVNHTSDQHPWFQRARHAKPGSAARDFYVWSDNDQKFAGTRIIFLDTEKSNWTWDPVAGAYFWHRFYSHQPDLNFDNPKVLKSVIAVMKFWLDLGVDGMRLDAVPYLIEREGTNNENLPETHAILKKIRAEVDRAYPGRMLLAEANQWPEDTQHYFGDGDECHMAFHFPLMPRMYMALAQEDRFPITDIMRQTPEIPALCQWAVFLRNHDELTLEMVSDRERDYLWETYASDRRARLNLGIRRRLAPLMQRDRRRVELLNSLLLSMPGTPVIYYGDEIGMGDNIHLGDRDGVRTPMQWSIDRNGGFSRADPASLVLPPIMDPLYGYQAVNVETQNGDQYSLLSWMRRMLGIRSREKAFGRGTLKFLYPANRRVLVYLREFRPDANAEGQTILCVANVSRAAQAVEIDLSVFNGRVPVEMVGGSAFPPIGQLPYLLTLPPFGFYWFVLATSEHMPAWHTPLPITLPEFATIVLRTGIEDLSKAPARAQLEKEVLPAYLPKRRWFGSKDQTITETRLATITALPGGERPFLLAEIECRTANGTERYLLPLGIFSEDETTTALPQQLALARIRQGRKIGFLTDGFTLEAFLRVLVALLKTSAVLPSPDGELHFRPTSKMATTAISGDAPVRWLSAEQSNSSAVIGDTAILKVIRRVSGGLHPEAEMGRYLTEHGFANIAPMLGEVVRIANDGTPFVLAVLQGFMFNQGDAWGWTQNMLTRAVQDAETHAAAEQADTSAIPESANAEADALLEFEQFASTLGRRLGEMHAVLAGASTDPAFSPLQVSEADAKEWAVAARTRLESALDILAARKEWPGVEETRMAETLLSQRSALLKKIDMLAQAGVGSIATRIHGDFHLGQVLVAQADAFIIDFEGEPARPLSERRGKSSPLKDVAGLVRSFDYAAAMAESAGGPAQSEVAVARRAETIQRFRRVSEPAFLTAYRQATRSVGHAWKNEADEIAVIDLFTIEKAAYEIGYEAANRPSWLGVPLRGLFRVAERLFGGAKNGE